MSLRYPALLFATCAASALSAQASRVGNSAAPTHPVLNEIYEGLGVQAYYVTDSTLQLTSSYKDNGRHIALDMMFIDNGDNKLGPEDTLAWLQLIQYDETRQGLVRQSIHKIDRQDDGSYITYRNKKSVRVNADLEKVSLESEYNYAGDFINAVTDVIDTFGERNDARFYRAIRGSNLQLL